MGLPSADIYARAVIAAAISYGDDPILALSGERGPQRRAATAAASAVAKAGDLDIAEAARPLAVSFHSVRLARSKATAGFLKAEREAEAACRHAGLRPPVAAPQAAGATVTVVGVERDAEEIKAKAARLTELRRKQEERPAAGPVYRPAPPTAPVPRVNARPAAPLVTDLEARILAELEAGEAITSQGLATRLDAKEGGVISALSHLEARHQVVSLPAPESASRRYVWKVTPIEATAHG